MLQEVVAVRDAKLEAFMTPSFFLSNGAAIRAFLDELLREQSVVKAHPEDYALFHIGVYNDQTGELVADPQPVHLVAALDGLKKAS